ncbi:6648_t:CDS:2 [Scutellospora calospora]|uniref:6648_t:CDS:1 n=1 Tax=Scutellospora calospora TaxID=85575 RepID=A0ACA9LR93_9GLOM|nr:6648_t:CDS:2 [Scutellospora calospora]
MNSYTETSFKTESQSSLHQNNDVITTSKKFFKIDMHTYHFFFLLIFEKKRHILPKHWPDLKKKYGYGGWVQLNHHEPGKARMIIDGKNFREIQCNCWSADERVRECDNTGVNVQVLSTIPVMFSYSAKPQHTLDLARYLNDHIAQVCDEDPKRFIGLGTLPMQSPELAVQELKRCVNELGLAGIQIGSHVNEWNLDALELDPIWEACNELKVPVFIHPWAKFLGYGKQRSNGKSSTTKTLDNLAKLHTQSQRFRRELDNDLKQLYTTDETEINESLEHFVMEQRQIRKSLVKSNKEIHDMSAVKRMLSEI